MGTLSLYAMYAKTLSAIAVISAAAVAAQGDMLKVNTPTFVAQCKPVKITWQGGEAPYHLYVTAPGNIREVKADLGDQKGTSFTWKVRFPRVRSSRLTSVTSRVSATNRLRPALSVAVTT